MRQKILFGKKELIEVKLYLSLDPYIYKLIIPCTLQSNLKNCQIFIFIMEEKLNML